MNPTHQIVFGAAARNLEDMIVIFEDVAAEIQANLERMDRMPRRPAALYAEGTATWINLNRVIDDLAEAVESVRALTEDEDEDEDDDDGDEETGG